MSTLLQTEPSITTDDGLACLDCGGVVAKMGARILYILAATDGLGDDRHSELKRTLLRIVPMLPRLIVVAGAVGETAAEYGAGVGDEYREAEDESEEVKKTDNSKKHQNTT